MRLPVRYPRVVFFVLIVIGSFFFVAVAHAAGLTDGNEEFQGLLRLIKSGSDHWFGELYKYAVRLFLLLAGIQFIWTFFPLVFRQVEFGEIVGELIRFILVIGFFWALLMYSKDWAEIITDSFRDAGFAALDPEARKFFPTKEMRPGEIFRVAVELGNTINGTSWGGNPIMAVPIAFAALVVTLCFAFIAAFMGLTLIESWIVINASVLFMGLGASQWTRDYALAVLRYSVSVGAKLFILSLIVGLIIVSAQKWQLAYDNKTASMWSLVGLALVCAYLTKTIPDLIQGLIMGVSSGSGAAIGSMASAGLAGATAAISTLASAGGGILGAMGSAAGSMAGGGGGLGGLLQASMAAGQAAGVPTGVGGAAGGMASGAGGAAAQAVMPRIAGGGAPAGADTGGGMPQLAGPDQGGDGAGGSAAGGDAEGAAQLLGPDDGGGGGIAGADAGDLPQLPAPDNNSGGGLSASAAIAMGATALAAGTKGLGTLAAISVPGMEGAAHSSGGGGRPGSGGLPGSSFAGDDQSKGKFAVQNPTPAQGSPSASTPPAPRAGPGSRP